MPSNAELITQIHELNPAYAVDGLKNAQLDDALKALKAQAAEAQAAEAQAAEAQAAEAQAAEAQAAEAQAAEAQAAEAQAAEARTVAVGHAVTTRRGILSGGETIYPDDVSGAESLVALVALGVVV